MEIGPVGLVAYQYKVLKSSWGIGKATGHAQVFKMPVQHPESGFPAQMLTLKIKFDEDMSYFELIKQL